MGLSWSHNSGRRSERLTRADTDRSNMLSFHINFFRRCCLEFLWIKLFFLLFELSLEPRLFHEKWFYGNYFLNFLVFVCHWKVGQRKILFSQKKFSLVFRKVFSFYLGRKTLFKSCKKIRRSCYLMIISNLIIKLLIAIYFILNIFFSNFIP